MQYAIDTATGDDEIRVATGVYTDVHVREAITQVAYLSKTLILRGGYTVTDWLNSNPALYPTVLDAQSRGRVFAIIGTITPTAEGFSITGGDATGLKGDPVMNVDAGGGVLAISATVTLTNNVIVSNTGGGLGGGVYIYDGYLGRQPVLFGNTIANNRAGGGGGVNVEGGSAMFFSNHITNNTAAIGGGVRVEGVNYSIFENNQFLNNEASGGGGLWIDEAYAVTGTTQYLQGKPC